MECVLRIAIHELWMRGDFSQTRRSRRWKLLWTALPRTPIPDWLPMQYVEWLPLAYEVAARFVRESARTFRIFIWCCWTIATARLKPHGDPAGSAYGSGFGVYVGMSRYCTGAAFRSTQGRHSKRRRSAEARTGSADRDRRSIFRA